MAVAPRFLADKSALSRLHLDPVQEAVGPYSPAGRSPPVHSSIWRCSTQPATPASTEPFATDDAATIPAWR